MVAYYGFNKLLLKKEVIFKEDLENIPGTRNNGNIDRKMAMKKLRMLPLLRPVSVFMIIISYFDYQYH
jgi:hypothetical protein